MEQLYKTYYGTVPENIVPLTGSASNRRYYRLSSGAGTCIGVEGTDKQENEAFITISRHFKAKNIPVPEVFAVSEDGMSYIQEDLGDNTLFDLYRKSDSVSA